MTTRLNVLPPSPDPLDSVGIATPCPVPWESLTGDDRVRHCGRCDQNVYNVAELTRPQALALIGVHEGRLCLRLLRRADGTLITADCWTRLRAARKRGVLALAVMLVIVGFVQLSAMVMGLWQLSRVCRKAATPVERASMGYGIPAPRREAPPTPTEATEPTEPDEDELISQGLLGKMAVDDDPPVLDAKARRRTERLIRRLSRLSR